MGTLGNISGYEAIKALARAGWLQDGQRGSHIILKKQVPSLIWACRTTRNWIVVCFVL